MYENKNGLNMTQEQKELLLKDLCARLPYEVKCEVVKYSTDGEMLFIRNGSAALALTVDNVKVLVTNNMYKIKPYLFPLSSMTDKQKEELFFSYIHNDIYFDDFTDYFLAGELWHDICVSMDVLPSLINWLNKNHFDINGLIPKGLAIDATNLNIY